VGLPHDTLKRNLRKGLSGSRNIGSKIPRNPRRAAKCTREETLSSVIYECGNGYEENEKYTGGTEDLVVTYSGADKEVCTMKEEASRKPEKAVRVRT